MEEIASALQQTVSSQPYYLQLNDASLPRGGGFTVTPPANPSSDLIEQPGLGHRTHALGIDQDIAWCYAKFNGDDGGTNRISGQDCSGQNTIAVPLQRLRGAAQEQDAIVLREGNHYHIRWEGP
jgi:hypothetical protein